MNRLKSLALASLIIPAALMPAHAGGASCGAGPVGGAIAFMLTMALGYWVLTLAAAQERPLFGLGRFVGGVILLASLIGLVAVAACGFCKMKSGCGAGGACPVKMSGCPMSGAGASAESPSAQ